jgi:DNA-binding response OmpR family regulator
MKRILVVDESPAVRETLHIILGRDFAVVQRAPLPEGVLSVPDEEADLLILGVPPGLEGDAAAVSKIAARVSCPVLLLVDSRSSADRWKELGDRVDCLVKPFNPYELREKVDGLFIQSTAPSQSATLPAIDGKSRLGQYLDFPYLAEAASALAK